MPSSLEAANKDLVRRYFDAMQRGAIEEALEFWMPEPVNYGSGRVAPVSGREGLAAVFTMLRAAFPDRRFVIDDLIADGDRIACLLTVSGTFAGPPAEPSTRMPPNWAGVEGTKLAASDAIGKSYSIKHIHVFRIDSGRIAEHWAARDDLGLLLQLGLRTT